MYTFPQNKITIMGLSKSNLPLIKHLSNHTKAHLTITDMQTEETLDPELLSEVQRLEQTPTLVLGKHNVDDFTQTDLIIKNPSIPPSIAILEKATNAGIPIETDITLFLKSLSTSNVIGVTGTKGKTTTTTFIATMLQDQGLDTVLAGNMGIPVWSVFDEIKQNTWVVLELSSYMTEAMHDHKVSPHIAIFTNIFPDHLNRHRSFDEYAESKAAIFAYQNPEDITLFSSSETLNTYKDEVPSQLMIFDKKDVPQNVNLKLLGEHNRQNVAAAFVLASVLNLDDQQVVKTAQNFQPIAHRMETIATHNRITFINDSAATNPTAFLADIKALLETDTLLFLLIGGYDKKVDYTEMAQIINAETNIKKIALFTGEASTILSSLITKEKQLGIFDSMPEAFNILVNEISKQTSTTLALMPGCASFGVFQNEFDRGEQFRKAVEDYISK